MKKKLLYTGGVLTLLFIVLHLFFPKMFDWEHSLLCLLPANRAVYLTFHLVTIFVFTMSVIISFVLARQKTFSVAERIVLLMFAGIYIIRIIAGPLYFGFTKTEIIGWCICLATALCFIIPALAKNEQ
jgi:hypothetical protein